MAKPTEVLSDEHKNILKLIDALTKESNLLKSGKPLNKDFFEKAVDFIKNYADKSHHAKEEEILFKELNKDSVEMNCNPTKQMVYEHEIGRKFVKGMEESLKQNNKIKLIENARGYIELLQDHIFKEDNILYPMSDQALNQKTQDSILKEFKQAELKKLPNGTKQKYLSMLKELGR